MSSSALKMCLIGVIFCNSQSVLAKESLTLSQAVNIAVTNDPWLYGSQLKQQAVTANSVSVNTLPDPTMSIDFINLPSNSWDFDQENMTQLKLGVKQMFSRGDERVLKQSKLKLEATKHPLLRQNRQAQVKSLVSQLWLDAYLAKLIIRLIEEDRALFEQMADITNASYSNAIASTQQQDVIRSQLELIQLEDRMTVEQQNYDVAMAKLSEWLQQYKQGENINRSRYQAINHHYKIDDQLPVIPLLGTNVLSSKVINHNELAKVFALHPIIKVEGVKQSVALKGIDLANNQYQPQWGLNASYAFREDAPNGVDRSDFFSVGVTFDLPIFSQNRQDKNLKASVASHEAVKTEKLLLLKNMISNTEKEFVNYQRLQKRSSLYQKQLLEQYHQHAQATLTAYTNDSGDFTEVISARIAELNARISAAKIEIELLKVTARINYFFTGTPSDRRYQEL